MKPVAQWPANARRRPPRARRAALADVRIPADRCRVFLDFDNTVTTVDVLDALIRRFAVTDEWQRLEAAWKAGRIGSQACLTGQLQTVRASRHEILQFLRSVRLDPACRPLLRLLRRRGMQPMILSDGFDVLIRRVLRAHQIAAVPVYANRLRFARRRLLPSFPYANGCARCANCKRQHLARYSARGRITVFVGDGLSDLCAAEQADVVFAKGRLQQLLRARRRPFIAFHTLRDVYHALQRGLT